MYVKSVPLVACSVILFSVFSELSCYKVGPGPIFRPPISVQTIPLEDRVKVEGSSSTELIPTVVQSSTVPNYPRRCWSPEKCCKYCKDLGFFKCVMHSCKKCQCDYSGGLRGLSNKIQQKKKLPTPTTIAH